MSGLSKSRFKCGNFILKSLNVAFLVVDCVTHSMLNQVVYALLIQIKGRPHGHLYYT